MEISSDAEDLALVKGAQQGDQAALDALLRRHYDRIYAVCRRLAGNDADALDGAQEALITIAKRIDKFDGNAKFSTWAYRVATNACLDEMRRRARRPDPGLPEFEAGVAPLHSSERSDHDDQVVAQLTIEAALNQLPEDFRNAVVLRDIADMDYAQIAEVLDIAPGTVRSRIARGRTALAEILGNQTPPSGRPSP